MRGSGRTAALLALAGFMVAAVASAQETSAPEELVDRSRDEILQRAEIRSRGRFHGEVRLVARGEARVVQTLLYSKVLRKVAARIREKEAESWPAARAGHEDSAAYVAALEGAVRDVREAARARKGGRRLGLLIEFWSTATRHGVALLGPDVVQVDDELSIGALRPIEELRLSREYVTQNMLLIAREHFPLEEEELRGLLRLTDRPSRGGPP